MIATEPRIVYDDGVHLRGTILWFDPERQREMCALSSARMVRTDRHPRVLLSDRTARLVAVKFGRKTKGLACPFNRSFSLGSLQIELFPSGYMAGASQFQVTLDCGHRIIYTGPFSLVGNRTAERAELRTCDTLVLDANYGLSRFQFPEREGVYAAVLSWARETLDNGRTPVFLVANPGKAQDLVDLLGRENLPLRVHRSIYAMNKAYRSLGIQLAACKQFRGDPGRGEIVLWPAHLRRSHAIRNLKRARFAGMTGTGDQRGVKQRLKINEAFAWSARADHNELLRYAVESKASKIVTNGRHAADLAATLRAMGLDAEPLAVSPQLDLLGLD